VEGYILSEISLMDFRQKKWPNWV